MAELGALPPQIRCPLPAQRSAALVDTLARHECPALTARRARRAETAGAPHDPIVWTRARGCNVVDADDNIYVDLSAGFGAAAVGHAHPAVVAAVQAQSERLMHALGDLHPSDVKVQLLSRLAALAPFDDAAVVLGLHGGDAVEAALKTAVLHTGRPGVLAFDGGYHGLSHGPLSICGYSAQFRAPFAAQLNPHTAFAPYPRNVSLDVAIAAVTAAWPADLEIGAVVVEPVLGRGGIVPPPAGFLAALGELCHARGAVLVVDAVMTGIGRSGELLGGAGPEADLICLGKALGGGMPVSACIGRREVMGAWGDPDGQALHTATFFGHPVGAAAALATLDVTQGEDLPARAAARGDAFRQRLGSLRDAHACVTDVRGRGLLLGIELDDGGRALRIGRTLLQDGYITVPAADDARVVSLTPPLTVDDALLNGFIEALDRALGHDA